MSLIVNMLSRLVITFLPRSKHLLVSWLQSPSAVIFEPPKIKSDIVSTVSHSCSLISLICDAATLVHNQTPSLPRPLALPLTISLKK